MDMGGHSLGEALEELHTVPLALTLFAYLLLVCGWFMQMRFMVGLSGVDLWLVYPHVDLCLVWVAPAVQMCLKVSLRWRFRLLVMRRVSSAPPRFHFCSDIRDDFVSDS